MIGVQIPPMPDYPDGLTLHFEPTDSQVLILNAEIPGVGQRVLFVVFTPLGPLVFAFEGNGARTLGDGLQQAGTAAASGLIISNGHVPPVQS